MTSRFERINKTLQLAFAPLKLEIIDESAKHASHAAQIGVAGGETHYRVAIVSEAFAGKSRVARHRLVYDQLDEEFAAGLHALAVRASTPDEA